MVFLRDPYFVIPRGLLSYTNSSHPYPKLFMSSLKKGPDVQVFVSSPDNKVRVSSFFYASNY